MMKRGVCFFFIFSILILINPMLWQGAKSTGLLTLSALGVSCDGSMPAAEEPDDDLDGLANSADNCPNEYNPSQTDTDGNGIGEACEDFELRDGILHCDFPSCDFSFECRDFVEQCPGTQAELDFTNQIVQCCDGACLAVDEAIGQCPEGTCQDNATHCEVDEDCEESYRDACQDGCCPPPEPPITDCFENLGLQNCDPENPDCDEGTVCMEAVPELFCCLFEGGPDPCGDGFCDNVFELECMFCPEDCLPEECEEPTPPPPGP